ncbi:MAG: RDD family protein [Myxococcota bacterium]
MSEPLRFAGFFRRTVALGLDAIVPAIAVTLGWAMGIFDVRVFVAPMGWFYVDWLLHLWLDNPAIFTAPALWFVLLTSAWITTLTLIAGRSPGAMALGMRIVDAAGEDASRLRCAGRALASLWTLASLGLGWLWIVASREGRAWHDLLSGSWVVLGAPHPPTSHVNHNHSTSHR